jgi:very-short-patch-repair endonuclease
LLKADPHPLTPAEKLIWDRVRNHHLGSHIRRQHVLFGRFLADFYCASARLGIEIDGNSHAEPNQAAYDAARTAYIEEHGLRVIRFTNRDVNENLEAVLETIQHTCT